MSHQLISRSPDLKRLRDEGYNVEIRSGYLLVKDVPYVNARKEVLLDGILVSELTTGGETTAKPKTHVAMFVGEYPCDRDGAELDQVRHSAGQQLAEDLTVQYSFSGKPLGGNGSYDNYYEKMVAYVTIFLSHAQAINPEANPKTFQAFAVEEDESVFKYLDTASSRAKINMVSKKLEIGTIAIVGLGGTGSYVLDLVAKTHVREIHLFDQDALLSHNAFRAPGAASLDELNARPRKVVYLRDIYSKMRRGVIDHAYHIDATNVAELQGIDFVFLCMDAGEDKRAIVEYLEAVGKPFVDAGMGVQLVDDSLRGTLRVTTSTPAKRDHFADRVSLGEAGPNDEYDQNIQIADLNALNAAMAVIKWKKYYGFYLDFEGEHHSTYIINTNVITSEVPA